MWETSPVKPNMPTYKKDMSILGEIQVWRVSIRIVITQVAGDCQHCYSVGKGPHFLLMPSTTRINEAAQGRARTHPIQPTLPADRLGYR